MSIFFALSNRKERAGHFHSCGLEIQRIYREYSTRQKVLSDDEIKEYTKQYDDVLLKYDINHSHSDYLKVKMTKEGAKIKSIIFYYVVTFLINYFILVLLLIVPIIVGIFIIRLQG
jgi:hypothetical protein